MANSPRPTGPRFASCLRRGLATATLAVLLAGPGCAHEPGTAADGDSPNTRLSPANQLQADGSLSAVEIRGQPIETVRETIESVFTDAGLALVQRSANHLLFERLSSRHERAAYGDWFEGDTRVRFHVDLQKQDRDLIFVKCRGVIARDAASFSPDEQPLARRRVRKYEGLLREVAQRLN